MRPMSTTDFRGRFNEKVAAALVEATKHAAYPSLLGIEVIEQTPGFIRCKLPVTEKLFNGVGTMHGGALVSVVDHALSLAVYPLVEVGKWVATLEFKIDYIAPVREGELICEATVLSLRRALGVVRVDVRCADQLVATALGTVYVRDRVSS
jgi:uncharacterized protein (TIGR00369 family)